MKTRAILAGLVVLALTIPSAFVNARAVVSGPAKITSKPVVKTVAPVTKPATSVKTVTKKPTIKTPTVTKKPVVKKKVRTPVKTTVKP